MLITSRRPSSIYYVPALYKSGIRRKYSAQGRQSVSLSACVHPVSLEVYKSAVIQKNFGLHGPFYSSSTVTSFVLPIVFLLLLESLLNHRRHVRPFCSHHVISWPFVSDRMLERRGEILIDIAIYKTVDLRTLICRQYCFQKSGEIAVWGKILCEIEKIELVDES